MSYEPYRVKWCYRRRWSSTTCGTKAAAEAFADALRKRGVKTVCVSPL